MRGRFIRGVLCRGGGYGALSLGTRNLVHLRQNVRSVMGRSVSLDGLRSQPDLLQRLTQVLRAVFLPAAQILIIATHGLRNRVTGRAVVLNSSAVFRDVCSRNDSTC